MGKRTHLIKLSVGTDDVADLQAWQRNPQAHGPDGLPRHVTRMRPRREADLVGSGSIFWVIKGLIQCRQRVIRLDSVDFGDGIERCAIVMEPELIRVTPVLRRPFQGWRYLSPDDAPPDLDAARPGEDSLPPELSAALAELGIR